MEGHAVSPHGLVSFFLFVLVSTISPKATTVLENSILLAAPSAALVPYQERLESTLASSPEWRASLSLQLLELRGA